MFGEGPHASPYVSRHEETQIEGPWAVGCAVGHVACACLLVGFFLGHIQCRGFEAKSFQILDFIYFVIFKFLSTLLCINSMEFV